MAIEILPPQLANQIAAGEVVERPASVVKELVENSIDAGASRVDIDIDKGGAKLIRIRDNGCGIPKKELSLALSRHATSKVHSLDDLEAIRSFGFRGEALASISSVSRLTLTSRTTEQSEAWAAYAEGSEMAVKVIPAAHPVGTSIEVVDLFFNTPARRRFLKSDKTEFSHIDEWLKRIALVQCDVHFTLSHNGKMVRNYRPAKTDTQYLQRLGQVCGKTFAEHALKVGCYHDDMHLSGYIQSPQVPVASDVHYFYVNGRLVRDRLVNHAVKQAFSGLSGIEQPDYVLMFELEPHQMDVNVHPAKHEVRFHQSRYVHDFILQTLQSVLTQVRQLPIVENFESEQETDCVRELVSEAGYADVAKMRPLQDISQGQVSDERNGNAGGQNRSGYQGCYQSYSSSSGSAYRSDRQNDVPSKAAVTEVYKKLMQTPGQFQDVVMAPVESMPPVIGGKYWVQVEGDNIKLIGINFVAEMCRKQELINKLDTGLVGQPLLMPVSIKADDLWQQTLENRQVLLRKLGLELIIRYGQLIVKKVPPYLRDSQLAVNIPELLQWLDVEEPAKEALATWLAKQGNMVFSAASSVWQQLKQLPMEQQQQILASGVSLPWQLWLKEQLSDNRTPA